ncbi:MAG: hypothetical protein HDQ44_03610 [Desulfovibrio sp.]|nr:hypothetical protein [Desulfovibrio sp.]
MVITCPQCGFSRDAPESKLPKNAAIAKCPRCGCRFRFSIKDGAGEIVPPKTGHADSEQEEDIRVIASNAYAAEATRFENERKAKAAMAARSAVNPWLSAPEPTGWIAAFYQTVIQVMFQAQSFFRTLKPETEIWRPLAFFLLVCVIQITVERAWGSALASFLLPEAAHDQQLQNILKLLTPETSLALAILLRSGILLLQLFIFTLLMFLVYRILAPQRAAFTLVYQVLAYSAAPWLLCVIPGIGSLAGAIWGISCMAIGMKTAMRLTWAQTLTGFLPVLAMLAPLVLQGTRILNQGI